MSSSVRPRLVCFLLASLVLGSVPGVAKAHGQSGEQLPENAPVVSELGKKAKAALDALDGDASSKELAAPFIARGRRALARAHGAHLAGDAEGREQLSRIALAAAEAGAVTAKARAAESKASAAEKNLQDLKDRVARLKTLVAETQAQRGQVGVELVRAREAARTAETSARDTETKRTEGKKTPKKRAP